jgi:hypothetical protein
MLVWGTLATSTETTAALSLSIKGNTPSFFPQIPSLEAYLSSSSAPSFHITSAYLVTPFVENRTSKSCTDLMWHLKNIYT